MSIALKLKVVSLGQIPVLLDGILLPVFLIQIHAIKQQISFFKNAPKRNLLSILIVAFLAGMPEHLSMQLVSAILIQLIPGV